jgi:DNA-binding MarR family transcriptional regulator
MDDSSGPIKLATPTLMRMARGAYTRSIQAELHSIGVDDLPRNGAFILAGIDSTGGPRQDLPSEFGVTRQAVSQVVDILVNRGYLDRVPDPDDRRRVKLELTERGREVVSAVLRGLAAVDRQLGERVSPEQVEAMRSVLAALTEIKSASLGSGAGRERPDRQFRRFSPIFPVRDLGAALAHYSALGFDTFAYPGGGYGFANREGTGLHLAVHADHADHEQADHDHADHDRADHDDADHDRAHHAAEAYLYVRDADALYEEWSRPGIGGRTLPVGLMAYKLREGSHIDPDGNLIRFGSPIDE